MVDQDFLMVHKAPPENVSLLIEYHSWSGSGTIRYTVADFVGVGLFDFLSWNKPGFLLLLSMIGYLHEQWFGLEEGFV